MVLLKTQKRNQPIRNLIRRRNLNYTRLPEQLLKLVILKLDGSSFSAEVARNATVAKLKSAIQEQFSHSLNGGEENLWSVVWSHFCLCYKGQKLLNDKARIRKYVIKDGDEIHFVQHLRVDPKPSNKDQNVSIKAVRNARKGVKDEYQALPFS